MVGEGSFCMTSVCGSSAFATTVGSGVAFTVGCFERTALGPAPFLRTAVGDGALDCAISVSGKLFALCCDARSSPDEVAS